MLRKSFNPEHIQVFKSYGTQAKVNQFTVDPFENKKAPWAPPTSLALTQVCG